MFSSSTLRYSPTSFNGTSGYAILHLALVIATWRLVGVECALVNVLAAPWIEETVTRLGFQEALIRAMDGANEHARSVWSAACAACLFAAAHVLLRADFLSAVTFFPAFFIGLVYARWRQTAPCVLLHALANLVWFAAIAPRLPSFIT